MQNEWTALDSWDDKMQVHLRGSNGAVSESQCEFCTDGLTLVDGEWTNLPVLIFTCTHCCTKCVKMT